jgi:hypothetical protein
MRVSTITQSGLKVQLFRQLRKNTIVHFDNGGQYGSTFEEIKIQFNGYSFRVIVTDGYKDTILGHMPTLKQGISLGRLHLERCK